MSAEKAAGEHGIFRSFEELRAKPKSVFLLDGGTGEELFKHGIPNDRKIWSAIALVKPEYHHILQEVHQSFVQAGSKAVTTNSYGVVPGVGFSEDEIEKYCKVAGEIAKNAVGKKALVFGSLPPLIESYRADMIMDRRDGVRVYRKVASALLPYVDAFLTETISCTEESFQVIEAVQSLGKPLLVSYTVNSNGDLRGGETVVEVVPRLLEYCARYDGTLLALLFNCSEPEAITKTLEKIQANKMVSNLLCDSGVVLGAYANRLTAVDPNWTMAGSDGPQPERQDLDEKHYYEIFVKQWVDNLGVQVIGGCCGITPNHIAYLHRHLGSE